MGLAMVLGFIGMSSAALVTDPAGDVLGGPGAGITDIVSVRAELTERGDTQTVLKLSLNTAENLGGVVMFEADVDNSTGTGGSLGMTGVAGVHAPVCRGNCPGGCKVVPGTDIVTVIFNRLQRQNAVTAIQDVLTGAKRRLPGEWYATSMALPATDYACLIRGFTDPTPNFSTTSHSYTLPWADICVWVADRSPDPYTVSECTDPATVQWQVSVWVDPGAGVKDDLVTTGPPLCFDLSDAVPNAGLVNGMDVGDALTYCEGNFDGNVTVDGLDAAKFKSDFGRGGIKNPCPKSNQMW
jgi:hypothetical protein